MDPTRLMTQTATIAHDAPSAGRDEYGNIVVTAATATAKCWLHQTQRSEATVSEDVQIETWQLYLPPGTVLDGADRVTVEGQTFELFGPPAPMFNPRLRRVTHIEATLKKVV